jgi:ribonuclease HI
MIRNGTSSSTNSLTRDSAMHLWKRTREAYGIRISWVRCHTSDLGKEMADKLAGERG